MILPQFAFMHPTLGLHAQQQYNANALQIGILFLIRYALVHFVIDQVIMSQHHCVITHSYVH